MGSYNLESQRKIQFQLIDIAWSHKYCRACFTNRSPVMIFREIQMTGIHTVSWPKFQAIFAWFSNVCKHFCRGLKYQMCGDA